MDKTNITVTMPVTEYERLKEMEKGFRECIKMFERAYVDGNPTFTDEIHQMIKDIYLHS